MAPVPEEKLSEEEKLVVELKKRTKKEYDEFVQKREAWIEHTIVPTGDYAKMTDERVKTAWKQHSRIILGGANQVEKNGVPATPLNIDELPPAQQEAARKAQAEYDVAKKAFMEKLDQEAVKLVKEEDSRQVVIKKLENIREDETLDTPQLKGSKEGFLLQDPEQPAFGPLSKLTELFKEHVKTETVNLALVESGKPLLKREIAEQEAVEMLLKEKHGGVKKEFDAFKDKHKRPKDVKEASEEYSRWEKDPEFQALTAKADELYKLSYKALKEKGVHDNTAIRIIERMQDDIEGDSGLRVVRNLPVLIAPKPAQPAPLPRERGEDFRPVNTPAVTTGENTLAV